MKGKEINADGSMVGKTFSGEKYTGEFPRPKQGDTYRDYRKRCDEAVKNGFHLGDLGWDDWANYCMGSGSYEGVCSFDLIK